MIQSVNRADSYASRNAAGGNGTSNLDKDAFLKLLITQLRYQDPTKPMEDREFIAQLAQFSSLEQMTNMGTGLEALANSMNSLLQMQLSNQALSLVGTTVEYLNPDYDSTQDPPEAKTITGTVSGVRFVEGIPVLVIGDQEVLLENIVSITGRPQGGTETTVPPGDTTTPGNEWL